MDNKTKKCPFRLNDDGEYMPCYGKECMAYYKEPYVDNSPHGGKATYYRDACKMFDKKEDNV